MTSHALKVTTPSPDRGIDVSEPPSELNREGDQLARNELEDRRTKIPADARMIRAC